MTSIWRSSENTRKLFRTNLPWFEGGLDAKDAMTT